MIRQIGIGIGMAFVSVIGFTLLTIAFFANLLGNVVSAIISRNPRHKTRDTQHETRQ